MGSLKRSLNEWLTVITEARQSGLSDKAWCINNGISVQTFYNAVKRLRKKACTIPQRIGQIDTHLIPVRQDVVRVDILPDNEVRQADAQVERNDRKPVLLDATHTTIEILLNGATVKVCNDADPVLLVKTLRALGGAAC